jgi:TetR/AcrR family transcriptional repressor of nem operon
MKMESARLKERLLDAAVDRLTAGGYGAASIRDIVGDAGSKKASFYCHFRSKEQLSIEAIKVYVGRLGIERLANQSASPMDRIRGYFESLAAQLERSGIPYGCLMGSLAASIEGEQENVRRSLETAYGRVTAALVSTLKEAQLKGEVSADLDADQLASVIFCAWQGALLRAKVEGDGKALDTFFSIVIDRIFRMS